MFKFLAQFTMVVTHAVLCKENLKSGGSQKIIFLISDTEIKTNMFCPKTIKFVFSTSPLRV